MGIYSSSKV